MSEEFERRLKASLDKHANEAPQGNGLAEQIIAEAEHGVTPLRPRRANRTWLFPLLAAAAVAALVLAGIGISQWRTTSSGPASAKTSTVPALATVTVTHTFDPSQQPSVSHGQAPAPAPAPATTPKTSPTQPRSSAPTAPVELHDFAASDVTFVSPTDGWALGVADCITDLARRCPALLHTADGVDWSVRNAGNVQFNVPGQSASCATECVDHIRFADASVGYVFSASALLMTTDGGQSWTSVSGGAVALETFDDNVIRVVSRYGLKCEAGCDLHFETAPIGSNQWMSVAVPGGFGGRGNDLQLTRTGSQAYALLTGFTQGGGNTAHSTLVASADDGARWATIGEGCPQLGGVEVDSVAVAASPGGVALLCKPRFGSTGEFLAVSTDRGAHFTAETGRTTGVSLLSGDPRATVVAAGAETRRTYDGGATWQAVPQLHDITFVGFESPLVGRALGDDGRVVWTTSDGGASWDARDFTN